MECTNENLKDMESSASGDSDKGSCTEAAQIGTTGRDPVEQGASRQEVTDITLGSYGLLESITGWGVSWEPPPPIESYTYSVHSVGLRSGTPDQEP